MNKINTLRQCLCIIIGCFIGISLFGQSKPIARFSHLTTADGLSQSTVTCILKDKYGFMWFGTMDGLNKYDGYRFKVYRNKPSDKQSLPNNQIKSIYEDQAGNLWVGTMGGGLARYNRNNDSFEHVIKPQLGRDRIDVSVNAILEDSRGDFWVGTYADLYLLDKKTHQLTRYLFKDAAGVINSAIITSIFEDNRKNLWIGTKNGLYLLNKANRTCRYFNQTNAKGSISDNRINVITQDADEHLWIGTYDGLNRFDYRTNTFTAYKKEQKNSNTISNNVVLALYPSNDHKLWIGTEEALELLDYKKDKFTHYQNNIADEESLNHNSIYSLLLDRQGILWIGTFAGGINKYDLNHTYFQLFKNFHVTAGQSTSTITAFAEQADGNIWVGTDGGSLNLWKRATNEFMHFDPNDKNGLNSFSVLSLLATKDKRNLWIGTYERGLKKLDLKTHVFSHYYKGNGSKDLSNNTVYALAEDRFGNIWLGTNGDGINIIQKGNAEIIKYRAAEQTRMLNNNYVRAFYEDNNGDMWIATYGGGINIYHPTEKIFTNYSRTNSNIQSDIINTIYGDSENNIWVGTIGGGLQRFDRQHKNFVCYREEQGLPSNIINSILEDNHRQLWISTNNGISRYSLANKTFSNYSLYNGLQGKEFFAGAELKTSTGEILFGGINGFNILDASSIKRNIHAPPIVFTDFQLFNKPVVIGAKESPLKQNINETEEIALAYNQTVFTIEFAALGYTIPEKNHYAYLLEGFDKEWNHVGNNRRATYTNLDAGTYIFKVRAANSDGIWNPKETTLKIVVNPPFWRTAWAYLLYVVFIAGVLYMLYLEIKSREKLKNEVIFERLTAKKSEEINQIKVNFFTNISHELRTPLSLILDPLRKIIHQDISMEQAKTYSKLVYKNAERLLNLVNQLLDFRRLETGVAAFKAHTINIIELISEISETFEEHALTRQIAFSVDYTEHTILLAIDEEKFEKILSNLLSNAFKFTPNGGTIKVDVRKENAMVEIRVIDSGLGIPEVDQDKIFEIFYKVEGVNPYENKSSGIGLALTKELVEMHGGRIAVWSEVGRGSSFVVYLPINGSDENYKHDAAPVQYEELMLSLLDNRTEKKHLTDDAAENLKEDKPIILLIEDNPDLQSYIQHELSTYFELVGASDGVDGLEQARQLIPDLVVSDIMMPKMNGLQVCQQLKGDERTSHIPLILLTAKQTDDNKIEGYTHGADAYIAKPFTMDLLIARINNLLDSRKKLRELFAKEHTEETTNLNKLGEIDREFLRKAQVLVEENFNNTAFNVDLLAALLNMSKRQLYRKIKALTNQGVQEFMLSISLQHARNLLLTENYTIAEIAYAVGFSEPSNFSRSFAKYYGMSPKNYLEHSKKRN